MDSTGHNNVGNAADRKQTWREWAGDKIRGKANNAGEITERVSLFPGWASRSYHNPEARDRDGEQNS